MAREPVNCDTSYHGYHFNWYKDLVIVRIGMSNSGPTRIPVLFDQLGDSWQE